MTYGYVWSHHVIPSARFGTEFVSKTVFHLRNLLRIGFKQKTRTYININAYEDTSNLGVKNIDFQSPKHGEKLWSIGAADAC